IPPADSPISVPQFWLRTWQTIMIPSPEGCTSHLRGEGHEEEATLEKQNAYVRHHRPRPGCGGRSLCFDHRRSPSWESRLSAVVLSLPWYRCQRHHLPGSLAACPTCRLHELPHYVSRSGPEGRRGRTAWRPVGGTFAGYACLGRDAIE